MYPGGLLRIVLLVFVWWILAGTLVDGWVAGIVAVGLGVALHRALGGRPRPGPRLGQLPGFLPYFAWQSVRGGWDVSRRAMSPSLPLAPDLVRYRLTLPPGPSRIFLTNALSLLPGTFGADLREDDLVVHLLVGGPDSEERIRELEERVARLFGLESP